MSGILLRRWIANMGCKNCGLRGLMCCVYKKDPDIVVVECDDCMQVSMVKYHGNA
jgi:hypothetical protein